MRSIGRILPRLFAALLTLTVVVTASLLFPTAAAANGVNCPVPASSALLGRFGDSNLYYPVIGGDVENSSYWYTGSGASIVGENEPWRILSGSDQHSVQITPGSWASPARTCVPFIDNLRMFVKSPGIANSFLKVHLDSLGSIDPSSSDYGKRHAVADYYISGASSGWQLSPAMAIPDGRGADGTQMLTITFGTSGTNATWRADDILMDPWKST